jgi:nitrate/nitrite transporter NarK
MQTIEQTFWVIVAVSWLIELIARILFWKTLSDSDAEIVRKAQEGEIEPHSEECRLKGHHSNILACIVYIAGYCVFVNSAILVAMVIKEHI